MFHCLGPVAVQIDGSCPALNLAQCFLFQFFDCLNASQIQIVCEVGTALSECPNCHIWANEPQACPICRYNKLSHWWLRFHVESCGSSVSWKSSEMAFAGKCTPMTSIDTSNVLHSKSMKKIRKIRIDSDDLMNIEL